MRRNTNRAESAPVVDPNAVYDRHQLRRLLRVRLKTITAEIRAGRLRVALVAGRYRFLGEWVLEWIAGSELHKTAGRNGTAAHANGKES